MESGEKEAAFAVACSGLSTAASRACSARRGGGISNSIAKRAVVVETGAATLVIKNHADGGDGDVEPFDDHDHLFAMDRLGGSHRLLDFFLMLGNFFFQCGDGDSLL